MVEGEPVITTFITTYRRPELLKRALSSVLSQTYPHFQVVVADNASGDETEAVVREFAQKDARVKYHRHAENIGMMANYQFCLSSVQTALFSFLSDDDCLLPSFYATAIEEFHRFPDAGFYAASAAIQSPEGKTVRVPLDHWRRKGVFAPQEALEEMVAKYPVPVCVLFHKRVVDRVSIDLENPLVWDCDFLLQVAARFPIVINKKICGLFQQHSTSFSNSQTLESWKSALNRLHWRVESQIDLSLSAKEPLLRLIAEDLKRTIFGFALHCFRHRGFEEAYSALLFYRDLYGSSPKPCLLRLATKVCLWAPHAYAVFSFLLKIKSFLKNNCLWMMKKKEES